MESRFAFNKTEINSVFGGVPIYLENIHDNRIEGERIGKLFWRYTTQLSSELRDQAEHKTRVAMAVLKMQRREELFVLTPRQRGTWNGQQVYYLGLCLRIIKSESACGGL